MTGAQAPLQHFELHEEGHLVGFADGNHLTFQGFATARDAMDAAAVASRALGERGVTRSWREQLGEASVTLATEERSGIEWIVSCDPVAMLRRPVEDGDFPWFGFTIVIDAAPASQTARGLAEMVFWKLREAQVRWAIFDGLRAPLADSRTSTRIAVPEPSLPTVLSWIAAWCALALSIRLGTPTPLFVVAGALLVAYRVTAWRKRRRRS
jgi:hypothetical protein